ncbi:MAG: ABC transporter permease [Bryobacteraceae bacterium]|nr:ABC transporter permease [Bryobacteraceae bacterium]
MRTALSLPIRRPAWPVRFLTMARVGWHLMTFNRLRLMATLLGVVFATILANQAIGTLLGLMDKFAMLERHANTDIWIVPKGTQVLNGGKTISLAAVLTARGMPDVALAMPMVLVGGNIKLPNGGAEPLQIVGTVGPEYLGGPWNLVAGDRRALAQADTVIIEDSQREEFGNVNLGSRREINEHLTTVAGFTYGLTGIGASFAFADYDYARELGKISPDQTNFGLIKVKPGADIGAVARQLAGRVPDATVLTTAELDAMMMNNLFRVTPIGIIFSALAAFGVLIGFIIVSLSIFSAVSDNLREFGTLKAVGARSLDLGLLLLAQAVAYGVLGSTIGLGVISALASVMSSGKMLILIQPWMIGATFALMTGMCCVASLISLLRLWRVEPGMVFR